MPMFLNTQSREILQTSRRLRHTDHMGVLRTWWRWVVDGMVTVRIGSVPLAVAAAVGVLSTIVMACSPDAGPKGEREVEDGQKPGPVTRSNLREGALLLYGYGKDVPLPNQASFEDGSCWDLTKIRPPWVVDVVTSNGVTMSASTEALKLSRLPLDTEQQRSVRLGFSGNWSGRKWFKGVSPSRLQELVGQGFREPAPERATRDFDAYVDSNQEFPRIWLVSRDQSAVCNSAADWAPNPFLICERRLDNLVIHLEMPAENIGRLSEIIDEFSTLVTDLACAR